HSGYPAFKISSFRPSADIFAFTTNKSLLPMLSLVWGVRAYYSSDHGNIEDYINHSIKFLKEKNLIHKGDVIVHVGSVPLLKKGKTNMMKLSYI
ncbi:MAG TPA: pyruvate kinase alpha/beta domain-containing protein, partial [Bacteroidales bacterium]|nr:pyruvate kinase alpha/beta domain-containing protein [Bacteroidales bacterium]